MATESPFRIIVHSAGLWDGVTGTYVNDEFPQSAWVGKPIYLHATVRCNGIDNAEIHVGLEDPVQKVMRANGAIMIIWYRGQYLTSGRLREVTGEVPLTGVAKFQMKGDWSLLSSNLGFVRPFGGDSYQYYETAPKGHYHWDAATQYTETAVRELIEKNINGPAGGWFTEEDGLRGGDIRAAGRLPMVRFQPLDELIKPMLEFGNLRLVIGRYQAERLSTLGTSAGSTAVRMEEMGEWGPVLSVEAGTIVDGSWTLATSSISHVVVGGPGEEEDRIFLTYTNQTREQADGWRNSVFKDATNIKLDWGTVTPMSDRRGPLFFDRQDVPPANRAAVRAQFDEVARKAFEEGAPTSSISVTLAETPGFHFGGPDGIQLGDKVKIKVGDMTFTDRLQECSLTLTENNLTVTPTVGERVDDPDRKLADAIGQVANSQRRLVTGR